jgi:hypothetical protein
MNDRQELIRRFAVAIAGAHQTRAFRAFDVAVDEVWRIATSLADREPPQPEPEPQPADDRIERALQLLRDAQAYDWVEAEVLSEVRKILESTP